MFFIKAATRQHISHTPMRVFNFVILPAVLIMSGTFQP